MQFAAEVEVVDGRRVLISRVAVHRGVTITPLHEVPAGHAEIAQQRWIAWRRKQHLEATTPASFGALGAHPRSEPSTRWPATRRSRREARRSHKRHLANRVIRRMWQAKATPQPAPATSRLTRERLTVPAGRVGLVRNEEPLVGFGQSALDGAVGVGLLGVGLVALERVEAQRAWMSRQARCSATPRSSSSSLFTSGARNTNMLRNWRWPLLRVRAASALLLAQAMRCRGWRAPCSVRALPVVRRHAG